MAEQLTIEIMTLIDLPAVVEIEKSCFKPPWPEEAFRTDLAYNKLAHYMVARRDGRIAGYIGGWIVLDEVHVTTLAVHPGYRRQGIAGALIQSLINEGYRRGALSITLEVRPSNKDACSFYKKWGFTVQGRRKKYYNDEDALIMTKNGINTEAAVEERKEEGGENG